MRRKFYVLILLLFGVCTVGGQPKPMTNDDVIQMVKGGLAESTIILTIERSPSSFDTSPQTLISLAKAGIPAKVMDAMVSARQTGFSDSQPAVKPAPTVVTQSPVDNDPLLSQMAEAGIYVVDNGVVKLIEPTVYSGSKSNPLLGAITYGLVKTKMRAKVQRKAANIQSASKEPVFYFVFNPAFKESGAAMAGGWWGLPATSPNEFVLAIMEPKSSSRETVVGEYGTFSGVSSGTRDKDSREFSFEKLRPGVYKVKASQAFKPGEYCFYYAANVQGLGLGGGKIFDFGIMK